MTSTANRNSRNRSENAIVHLLLSWSVPAVAIISWQLLAVHGVISSRILPAPSVVFAAGERLWHNGQLQSAIAISSERAGLGFLIGGGIGFLLGLLNGLSRIAETLLDSSVQMLRNIPHLALIPLVILWFGIGEPAKLFLVTLGVFFPIYLNTFHGVRSIDPALREMASVYGVKSWSLFWNVILPGAMPSVLVGVRYALGLMWLTLIVAETIAGDSGIGYITMNARDFMQTDVVLLGIVVYAVLGKAADAMARLLERVLLKWQPAYQS
ncbi:MAG: ABC transporter permease subunit [Capsulimonadaceae bacterium]|nr:ABC transporter permease subunit [Capsulimonadaceae bacterium]